MKRPVIIQCNVYCFQQVFEYDWHLVRAFQSDFLIGGGYKWSFFSLALTHNKTNRVQKQPSSVVLIIIKAWIYFRTQDIKFVTWQTNYVSPNRKILHFILVCYNITPKLFSCQPTPPLVMIQLVESCFCFFFLVGWDHPVRFMITVLIGRQHLCPSQAHGKIRSIPLPFISYEAQSALTTSISNSKVTGRTAQTFLS